MDQVWDFPEPFLYPTAVTDQHIDELGHSNNTVYIQWCQHAAWRHSGQLGLDSANYNELKRAMAIQEANYRYLAPSYLGDKVIVATWITACDGRLKMERSFQINNADTGECLFRGRWHLVCINLNNGKPVRIPELFKTVYLPHVITPY